MSFTNLFSFYRSKEWEHLRASIRLERLNENGDLICEHCHKPIVNAYDAICHHKVMLNEGNVNDYDVSLNADNIMVVHHKCHNEIHKRFGTYTRHVYLVYGAPCSGKSTYVKNNSLDDDLIIDIDKIYQMISNNDSHIKSARLKDIAFKIHRELLDIVKCRYGRWINAWIVGGFPLSNERERMAAMLGAELVYIESNKELCLARANERGQEYKQFIEDWFTKFNI